MADPENVILKCQTRGKLSKNITLWVTENTRAKYSALAEINVRVAEHLRQAVERELNRIIEIECIKNPEFAAVLEAKEIYE